MRVLIVGIACVGKSTVGRYLADKWGYTFIDFDFEVEKRLNEHITSLKNRSLNEYGYRQLVKHVLRDVLNEYHSNLIIAMPPGGLFREYYNYIKLNPDIISVALKDRAKEVMKRLTFYDDESRFMPDYRITERTYAHYYNEVKEDIAYFHPQYKKKANILFDMDGRTAQAVTDALAERIIEYVNNA